MLKKTSAKKDNRSIKTFFLYAFIVILFIVISLAIKTITLIGQSKYDGRHFVLSISSGEIVEKIAGFDSENNSISILNIKNGHVNPATLGKDLGVVPDANLYINSGDSRDLNIDAILTKALLNSTYTNSDLTFIDLARLIYFSKNAKVNAEEIKLPAPNNEINEVIRSRFNDSSISSENITVQIINATETSGLGQRMERVVVNMGGNVVAVSTSRNLASSSVIQYYGESTYTLEKLNKLFKFSVEKKQKKSIADIIIIIGENSQDMATF